jgi:GTP-binding protein
MPKPMIALVGRPNVGKSTLFNRLLRRRVAIVDDKPGVTRDRLHAEMEWNGVPFTLVDTGGLMTRDQEELDALVSAAAEAAISEADRLVYVVDGTAPITDLDTEIARKVQRSGLPVILAVTKTDNPKREVDIYEFYSLGLGDPVAVSGVSGLGAGDLLDAMVDGIDPFDEAEKDEETVHLAILGRPNAGKSSLVNRLAGEELQIVSEVPGTTRDPIDHTIRYMKREIVLLDTAGLRRKWGVHQGEALEYYTSLRTLKALERSNVAVVLLDAQEGLTQYERRLLDEVRLKGKGLIAVFNKWDLVEKDHATMKEITDEFRFELPDLDFIPVQFISALTGMRARKVLDLAVQVHDERRKRITTSQLNDYVSEVIEATPPPAIKGKWLRIKYASQVSTEPPVFAMFMNFPELMPDNYKRFLERRIREKWGFKGVPIRVVFRKK